MSATRRYDMPSSGRSAMMPPSGRSAKAGWRPGGKRRPAAGWSMVEVVASSLIAGLMLVGAMLAFSAALRSATSAARTAQATALAEDLMEEILQASYRDPDGSPLCGPEEPATGSRAAWDDIDDYAGWVESPPQARDGGLMDWLSGWQREVTVANVDPSDLSTPLATTDDRGVRRIQVVVKYRGETMAELVALKTATAVGPVPRLTDDRTTAAKPAGNQAPFAVASATPLSGAGQVAVQFDATGSRDPDADPLSYLWDFGDGQQGSGPRPRHTYANASTQTKVFTAVLTVTDASGTWATDRLSIVVFPAQP